MAFALDRHFYRYLKDEGHLLLEPDRYAQWQRQRIGEINPLLERLSVHRFGLVPEYFSWSAIITHQFTDATIYRFLGHILLIASLASLVEPRVHRSRLLALWLVSLAGAACLYVFAAGPVSPVWQGQGWTLMLLLGLLASDSIGRWRSVGRQQVVLSGALALVVWLLYLLQWWHGWLDLGGIVCSLLVCVAAFRAGSWVFRAARADSEVAGQDALQWAERVGLAEVMQSISSMDFAGARKQLLDLIRTFPNSRIILEQLYCLEKLQPEGETFWACARKRVDFAARHDDHPMMLELFTDVRKAAVTKERARHVLKPEHYHQMMAVFLRHGDLDKAEQVYLFLELAGDRVIIREACRQLHDEHRRRNNAGKAHAYAALLERMEADR
jgi:membrane associated rhomboid family serine protease